jgi:hypothetical protein
MSRRWTAKCWMGSSSGYVDIEVNAATINGAKEQLQNVYGAEQIINLREIGSGGSPFSSGDSGGMIWLLGIGFVLYLLVTYWYIAIPIATILGILIYMGRNED